MTDEKHPDPDQRPGLEEEPEVNFMVLGIGFGVGIGAAIGIIIGHPVLLIGIGAALGVGIGNYMAYVRERE